STEPHDAVTHLTGHIHIKLDVHAFKSMLCTQSSILAVLIERSSSHLDQQTPGADIDRRGKDRPEEYLMFVTEMNVGLRVASIPPVSSMQRILRLRAVPVCTSSGSGNDVGRIASATRYSSQAFACRIGRTQTSVRRDVNENLPTTSTPALF